MILRKDNFVRPVSVSKIGYETLDRAQIEHPAAKFVADASKWVDFTVGDGSVSVLLLTGSMLERAQELMGMEIHPSSILDGYVEAGRKAQELMKELSTQYDPLDRVEMTDIARSCIETITSFDEAQFLAPLVVEAAEKVKELTHLGYVIDPEQVSVVKKTGASILKSELINGIALYREPTSGTMPRDVRGARIAFIGEKLKMHKTVLKPEITIDSPEQMLAYRDEQRAMMMEKARAILRTGANVIISRESYDDHVQVSLGRMGIMAIRRAQKPDIEKLARATGGNVVPLVDELRTEDLGYAEHIYVRNLEQENWLIVEGCKDPKSVTLLLRGSSSNAVEAAGRAVRAALYSLDRATRNPRVFPGGGALEAELAFQIRSWARSLHGRKQLAAVKYADALESVPITLAESCGLNILDSVLEMRAAHARGQRWFGVDVKNRRLANMERSHVIDLLEVKSQVLKAATDVAMSMIRVDDVFTKPKWNPPRVPPGPASKRVTPVERAPDFHYGEARQFLPETW